MNLDLISTADLERIAQGLTPQQAAAEVVKRQKQSQAQAEMEYYTTLSVTLSEQLDQLIPEYEARYQPLAQALTTNPESKLIPELTTLYRSSQAINDLVWQYIYACLFCGSISDPLISDHYGKPAKGKTAIMDFIWRSKGLGDSILRGKVSDELLRRTGRRDLFSFPQPVDSRLAATQAELLAIARQNL